MSRSPITANLARHLFTLILFPHDLSQLACFLFSITINGIKSSWAQSFLDFLSLFSIKDGDSGSSSLFDANMWQMSSFNGKFIGLPVCLLTSLIYEIPSRHVVRKNMIMTLSLCRWLALSRCCCQIWKVENLWSCRPLVKAFRLVCVAQHTLLLLLCLKFIALYIVSFKMVKPHSLEKLMTCTLKRHLN